MSAIRPFLAPGFNTASIRAFDVRGVVGRDLDVGDARILGGAYATLARARGLRRIGVGRDGRTTSPALEAALVEALVEGGLEVVRIGVGPTPMLAFAVRRLRLDGGIMVTASHNPPPENGFKILLGGDRVHGAALHALVETAAEPRPDGRVSELNLLDDYVDELVASVADLPPMRVAWDCGSGATGEVVERLVRRLPGEHVLLHTVVDGAFPHHHADPAVEANMRDLQRAVVAQGCDLGLAFDGDGDRVGAVDGAGAMVWADQLLLLLARDLLRDRPGATVVGDVKCSQLLFEGVAAAGGRAVLAPSGYVLVREAMRREGALLGGELSGHVFFADTWDGTDDALYAALRTLRAVSREGVSLGAFREGLPTWITTPEFRIACAEPRKSAVVAEVTARVTADGCETSLADGLRVITPDGWWLLRGSNTEPKLTCRCEARSEEGLERLMSQLRHELRTSGVELG